MNQQSVTLEDNLESACASICPFLGMGDDPNTSIAYPSAGNVCHRTKKTQLISQVHQNQFCLNQSHDTCPTFRDVNVLVADIDVDPVNSNNWVQSRPLKVVTTAGLLLILFVAAFALWPLLDSGKANSSASVVAIELNATEEGALIATENVDPTPTLDQKERETDSEPLASGPTATAVANTLAKSKQETSTPIATATAVIQPTNTAQPTATIATLEATATPEPQATSVPVEAQEENIAPIDDNITYTYGTGVIDIGQLNMRRRPEPQSNIISTLSKGEIVTLTGRNGDSSWARVRLNNGVVGWVYAEYVIAEPALDRLPFIPRSQR